MEIPFSKEIVGLVLELEQQDAVGATIRSMIHLEHQLIGIIEDQIPNPDAIAKSEISFGLRVDLALSFGLPAFFKTPLKSLAGLRNRIAHRLESQFGEAELNDLIANLAPELSGVYSRLIATVNEHGGLDGMTRKLSMDDALDRYIILVVTIMLGLTTWRSLQMAKPT